MWLLGGILMSTFSLGHIMACSRRAHKHHPTHYWPLPWCNGVSLTLIGLIWMYQDVIPICLLGNSFVQNSKGTVKIPWKFALIYNYVPEWGARWVVIDWDKSVCSNLISACIYIYLLIIIQPFCWQRWTLITLNDQLWVRIQKWPIRPMIIDTGQSLPSLNNDKNIFVAQKQTVSTPMQPGWAYKIQYWCNQCMEK